MKEVIYWAGLALGAVATAACLYLLTVLVLLL